MGQIDTELYKAKLPNSKILVHNAEFAYINRESGELVIKNKICITNCGGLKDIEYAIIDGILYISGTEVRWDFLMDITEDGFGGSFFNPKYFEISEKFFKKYNLPEDCVVRNLKRGWRRKKVPFAVEIDKYPHGAWFPLRKEYKFEYCMHPFKIYE